MPNNEIEILKAKKDHTVETLATMTETERIEMTLADIREAVWVLAQELQKKGGKNK